MSKVVQKITVRSPDRVKFMDTVVEMAALGAQRAKNAVPKMISPFWLDMTIEVDRDNPFKSTPTMIAYPVAAEVFTESQMVGFSWDEFRAACAKVGVKGRDRQKMLDEYMEKVRNLQQ